MVDEVDRHAMEAADKSKIYGIMKMPIAVQDTPKIGGVMAAPAAGKAKRVSARENELNRAKEK